MSHDPAQPDPGRAGLPADLSIERSHAVAVLAGLGGAVAASAVGALVVWIYRDANRPRELPFPTGWAMVAGLAVADGMLRGELGIPEPARIPISDLVRGGLDALPLDSRLHPVLRSGR